MPDVVSVNSAKRIIEVKSFGKVSVDDIYGSIKTILSIVQSKGISKVLVDTMEIHQMPGSFDLDDLAERLPRATRIAMLAPNKKQFLDDVRQLASAAMDRGFVIKLFNNKQEALRWLA